MLKTLRGMLSERVALNLKHRRTLRLEPLETRVTPAVFMVTNTADAGPWSLRQAIADANSAPGADSIGFMFPGMVGGPKTISLLSELPALSTDIIISGGNITVTRGVAADFRIFEVTFGATCTLNGLSITGGSKPGGSGGGVANWGTLTLSNVEIYDNAAAYGGGVYNGGKLTVTGSHIYLNQASHNGGGIHSEFNGPLVDLSITDSHIYSNTATNYGGGVSSLLGDMVCTNTRIYGNWTTDRDGGGLYLWSGTLAFHGGLIDSNSSGRDGGGVYIENGTVAFDQSASVSRNSAGRDGGGILINAGTLTMTTCFVLDNTAVGLAPGIGYRAGATVTLTAHVGQREVLI
jgi:hypothetical protein